LTDQGEQLLGEIARRNWIILALLVLASLPWRAAPVSLGVFGGGLLAIVGYRWMQRSLTQALAAPSPASAKGFQVSYFIRLGTLGAALFLLITRGGVSPIALAVGLAVVPLNIFWTTIKRTTKRGGGSKP